MRKNAFTLLELLVVIGIIGILVALATVSYSSTQRSGRDTKRKQDMIAIQNALEQYYSATNYVYPNGPCSLAQTYMKSAWPQDPDNTGTYIYSQSCIGTSYCVCALMEKAGAGNSADSACGFSNASKLYYCVGNLQ